jgi:hypothetical protein
MQAEVVLNDHAQTRQLTPAVSGTVWLAFDIKYAKVEIIKIRHRTKKKEITRHSCCRVIIFILVHTRPLASEERVM